MWRWHGETEHVNTSSMSPFSHSKLTLEVEEEMLCAAFKRVFMAASVWPSASNTSILFS